MKNKKGSILAYSLIIIAMMVAIVSTLSFAVVTEKKNASSTEFSVQAYQVADSGIQLALKKINSDLNADIQSAFTSTPGASCNNGIITGSEDSGVDGATYDLYFYNPGGNQVNSCSFPVNQIKAMKSLGKYRSTVRAVNVTVLP